MASAQHDEGLRRYGPQTAAGLERCRQARWKHGRRSASAIALRKAQTMAARRLLTELRRVERELRMAFGPDL